MDSYPTLYLDLETESGVDLGDLGTDAYARDCRVITGSYALDAEVPQSFQSEDHLCEKLRCVARESDGVFRVVAHNALFEHAVLMRQMPQAFALIPRGGWRCSMLAARSLNLPGGLEPLHAHLFPDLPGKSEEGKREVRAKADLLTDDFERLRILSERCREDVAMTRRVWELIGPMLCALDKALMPIDTRINARGVPVDRPLCTVKAACIEDRRRALEADVMNAGWGAMLESTRGYRLSSERKVKRLSMLLEGPDLDRLWGMAHEEWQLGAASAKWLAGEKFTIDGRACNTLIARNTHSGRWTGKHLQLQNMKRPVEGQPLLDTRTMIKAPDGYSVLSADFSQMELRVGLWMAHAKEQLSALAEGRDLYSEMAESALGRKPKPEERFMFKTVLLGLMYGAGKKSTFERMESEGAPPDLANAVWKELERDLLPKLRGAWDRLMAKLKANDRTFGELDATWLRLPLYGRPLLWHGMQWGQEHGGAEADTSYTTWKGGWVRERLWGGTAYAHVVSGTCADIMAALLVKAEAEFEPTETRVIGHCHDEIICLTPKGTEERVGEQLKGWMRAAGKVVPMDAEVGHGDTWAEAK